MTNRIAIAALALALPFSVSLAQAGEGGGDRMQAGGGHMSSYVNDPYHDPRSLYAQRRGTGQLLGAPMYPDAPPLSRRDLVSPHWAVGQRPDRARR